MIRYLLVFVLSFCMMPAFAQRYSQYNTGTLYDSFENPAQRAFIPDSSRYYAFNFFIPTVSANVFLNGNAQNVLLQRAFLKNYAVTDSTRLKPGVIQNNHARANAGVYLFMAKIFTSLDGDQEIGISAQTRGEGKGITTDQGASLVSDVGKFAAGTTYTDVLNTSYYFQTYNQLSFSYREKVSKNFAFGLKLSALMGIKYNKLDIDHSHLTYNQIGSSAISLQGNLYSSYTPGKFKGTDFLPGFNNPGAAISIGTMLHTSDGFVLQWNIKDLGFIHWSQKSYQYSFNNSRFVNLNQPNRQDSLYRPLRDIVLQSPSVMSSMTTAIDGRAEFSAARTYMVADNDYFEYTPALILSKQLFDTGMEGALVNHFQYHNAIFTLTGSYNDLKVFSLGTQIMIKSPNAEFFIGSDALGQTIATAQAIGKNEMVINRNPAYSAASIYLGFSVKFGDVIEHPMNASVIPMGEKGFFGRLYSRLFKTDK